MVKKLSLLLMVVTMIFSFSACEMDEESLGMLMMLASGEQQAYDGVYEDEVFVSPNLGVSVALGDMWNVSTLDEIVAKMENDGSADAPETMLMLSFMKPQFYAEIGEIKQDYFAFSPMESFKDSFANVKLDSDGACVSLISMDMNFVFTLAERFGSEGEVPDMAEIEADFWESALGSVPNEVTDEYEIQSEIITYPVGDGGDYTNLLFVRYTSDGSYMTTITGFFDGKVIMFSGIARGESYISALTDVLNTVTFN